MKKRLMIQIGLVIAAILVSIFLYRIGKGFQFIVENKNYSLGDVTFELRGPVRVTFDDEIQLDLGEDEANLALLIGYGKHKIKVDVLDENGNVVSSTEKIFNVSGKEGDLLSIPALLGGSETWIFKRET